MLKLAFSEVGDPLPAQELPGVIGRFDKAIARQVRRIGDLIADEAAHAENCRILVSLPGEARTAATPFCRMHELGTVGRRRAAALIGVAPMARDSGIVKRTRRIRGGRRRPRDPLCMAAMSAAAGNPEMKAIHDRLKVEGKRHKVAIVAVMRRLIVLANARLRDRRVWT